MALARCGVYYPGAGQKEGWAWAGSGDEMEAVGLDFFVKVRLECSMTFWLRRMSIRCAAWLYECTSSR